MASQASARPNCRAAFISRGITSIRCLAITLVLTLDGVSPWQAPVDPPVTRQEIARAIGTDADAGAVLKLVIAHAMAQSHREFFLASQIPDDWLPRLAGVEFVRLGQAEAVKHLAALRRVLGGRTGSAYRGYGFAAVKPSLRRVLARIRRIVRRSWLDSRSSGN